MKADKKPEDTEVKLKPLTFKEREFCEYYTADSRGNGSKAAIKAGYAVKSAKVTASRLLTKANVKAYIEQCHKDTEKLAGISRLRNAQELAAIAYSSMASMHNTWIDLKVFEELTEEQKAAIESTEHWTETRSIETPNGKEVLDITMTRVKIKLWSKLVALDAIAKMFGYYEPDKMDINGSMITKHAPISPAEIAAISNTLNNEL